MTAESLVKAREAQAYLYSLWCERAIEKVDNWAAFVKREKTAYASFKAGELSREGWARVWAASPPMPSTAEYEAAAKVAAITIQEANNG